jgi:hypothetical protein
VQDRVEVPDPAEMLLVERVHARLVEFSETARATVPAKPFEEVTDIVDGPAAPRVIFSLVGLAEIVKS